MRRVQPAKCQELTKIMKVSTPIALPHRSPAVDASKTFGPCVRNTTAYVTMPIRATTNSAMICTKGSGVSAKLQGLITKARFIVLLRYTPVSLLV